MAGYARLMEDPDPRVRSRAAASWMRWEDVVLSLEPVITACELARARPGAELLIDDHSGHRGSDIKRGWMLGTLARFARR